jgi:hypothetical protein
MNFMSRSMLKVIGYPFLTGRAWPVKSGGFRLPYIITGSKRLFEGHLLGRTPVR